jgi:tRNA threonylcarbamoyladenosine biosynthesis protein TsaE
MDILSQSVEETRAAGAALAQGARVGDVFALVGELGCGKTELTRGFVSALCGDAAIRSPSFSIINIYDALAFPIYHFDFYRLKKAAELIEIGFEDYVYGHGVCLIEWADMFPEVIPSGARFIRFTDKGNGERLMVIQ